LKPVELPGELAVALKEMLVVVYILGHEELTVYGSMKKWERRFSAPGTAEKRPPSLGGALRWGF